MTEEPKTSETIKANIRNTIENRASEPTLLFAAMQESAANHPNETLACYQKFKNHVWAIDVVKKAFAPLLKECKDAKDKDLNTWSFTIKTRLKALDIKDPIEMGEVLPKIFGAKGTEFLDGDSVLAKATKQAIAEDFQDNWGQVINRWPPDMASQSLHYYATELGKPLDLNMGNLIR